MGNCGEKLLTEIEIRVLNSKKIIDRSSEGLCKAIRSVKNAIRLDDFILDIVVKPSFSKDDSCSWLF